MTETIQFPIAIVDEPVFLLPNSANLLKSTNIANHEEINSVNKNALLILYSVSGDGDLGAETLAAMDKLISAVALKPEETTRIKIVGNETFRLFRMMEKHDFKQLICFGIMPEQIGLHVEYKLYKSFKFNNLNIVICDSLEGMEKQKRLALWNQLKLMFNI